MSRDVITETEGRRSVVCMFINLVMISGLHNQHLPNTHAAQHSQALKPTSEWASPLFTWHFTHVPLFLPIPSPAHTRSHLRCRRPESLSDNASAFSSRAKQLHRRMWWRDMKVRRWSPPACQGFVLTCSSLVPFLPQMKLIIALVVFALLLIIISECLDGNAPTVHISSSHTCYKQCFLSPIQFP